MKNLKRAVLVAGSLLATLGIASLALAATATTSTDVSALATAEAKVVSVLHGYKDTSAWKAQFDAAVATQAGDLAKVKTDLGSSASTGSGTVVYSFSGSGIHTTSSFVVPAAAKGWHVNWSYNCASFGGKGNFGFYVFQGTVMDDTDFGPNQLGAKGSGVEHYYDTGTFHLTINSECDWTVQAVTGS